MVGWGTDGLVRTLPGSCLCPVQNQRSTQNYFLLTTIVRLRHIHLSCVLNIGILVGDVVQVT